MTAATTPNGTGDVNLLLTFTVVDGGTTALTTSGYPSAEAAAQELGEAIRSTTTIALDTPAGKLVVASRHIVSIAITETGDHI